LFFAHDVNFWAFDCGLRPCSDDIPDLLSGEEYHLQCALFLILWIIVRTLAIVLGWRKSVWHSEWGRHDPLKQHWHLGPIGVLPTHQGSGIGSILMERFCKEVAYAQLYGLSFEYG